MSLFDDIMGKLGDIMAVESAGAEGARSPSHNPHAMLESVVGLITQHGGLGGLLEKFRGAGLGDVISSWIGTGDNQAVSGEQLESAVGSDVVAQIAEKLGATKEHALHLLAAYLPMVIDRLTPDGKVGEEAGWLEKGFDLLKSQFLPAGKPEA